MFKFEIFIIHESVVYMPALLLWFVCLAIRTFGGIDNTLSLLISYFLSLVPTAVAQDVRAQPWNATACLVHWIPVEENIDYLKGTLGGYRVSA